MSIEQNDPDRWRKSSTRAEILQAARRIAAREGAEAVTLSRVAAEAGFAAPAVYAYFVSRDELQSALVTDDLETLAEAVRAEAGEEPAPESAVIAFKPATRSPASQADTQVRPAAEAAAGPLLALSQVQQALGAFTQADTPSEPEEPSQVMAPDPAVEASARPGSAAASRRAMRDRGPSRGRREGDQEMLPLVSAPAAPSADPADALARLEAAVADLQARPVDAWLERRLRVFERTLADLEARMESCERTSALAAEALQAQSPADRSAIGEAVTSLHERGERQQAALSDFRQYVKEMAGRLGALEGAVNRLAAAVPAHSPGQPTREADYLDTARHAAIDAARMTASAPARKRGPRRIIARARRLPRWVLWATLGALLIAAALIVVALTALPASPARPAVSALPAAQTSADARVVQLAKAGNAQAETVAGLKLLNGDGTATDIPSAAVWLGRAAAQHQPVAEYWLGTLYERGRGVALDKAKAMDWYAAAAKAGNAKAMYRLGVGYAEGWSGKADVQLAARWFQMAAGYGIVDAQFNLAVLYEKGAGVPENLSKAFTWYAIAAGQGDAESKLRLDALASKLSAADVTAAEAEAAKFQPQTPPDAANEEPTVASVARLR